MLYQLSLLVPLEQWISFLAPSSCHSVVNWSFGEPFSGSFSHVFWSQITCDDYQSSKALDMSSFDLHLNWSNVVESLEQLHCGLSVIVIPKLVQLIYSDLLIQVST